MSAVGATRHGMAWTEKGEFDQAVADITGAVTIDPKYAFGFGRRGQALFKKSLITKKSGWESAIADYSEAIKLDPNLFWLYSSRGVAYSNNRQYNLVVPDCSEVIKREPKNSGGYNCHGVAYEGLRDYRRAIADLLVLVFYRHENRVLKYRFADCHGAVQRMQNSDFDGVFACLSR